jgi:hypothetical protein
MIQRRGRHEIDDQKQWCDKTRRRQAACERHEDQRRAEAGKSAGRSRDERDHADGNRRADGDPGRKQGRQAHALVWGMM